jgi:hypothetical protein
VSANHAPACKAFQYPGIGECSCGAPKTRPKSSWELRAERAEAQRDGLLAAARLAIEVIGNTRDELGLKIEAEKAYLALLAAITEAK